MQSIVAISLLWPVDALCAYPADGRGRFTLYACGVQKMLTRFWRVSQFTLPAAQVWGLPDAQLLQLDAPDLPLACMNHLSHLMRHCDHKIHSDHHINPDHKSHSIHLMWHSNLKNALTINGAMSVPWLKIAGMHPVTSVINLTSWAHVGCMPKNRRNASCDL